MLFLTEEDIRVRCPQPGGTLRLGVGERLTPAAAELAAKLRATVEREGKAAAASAGSAPTAGVVAAEACCCRTTEASRPAEACGCKAEAPCPAGQNMTHLDAATVVPKSHPRIVLRGRLDSLLAAATLMRTQYDPHDSLPGFLKTCLADVSDWIMQVLAAEVSGSVLAIAGMGGMDPEALRAISQNPEQYLGVGHYHPDPALGGNAALLNWLRTQVREAEVAAVQCNLGRADIAGALNRLSSAVYVLLLLTLAAERGLDIAALRK